MAIDLVQARALLKQAVETQGRDFIYNPDGLGYCTYAPLPFSSDMQKRATGCLIGVALTIAGETRHLDFTGPVGALADAYEDMMTVEAAHYFGEAQWAQDHGDTWGRAYDKAEASLSVQAASVTQAEDAT